MHVRIPSGIGAVQRQASAFEDGRSTNGGHDERGATVDRIRPRGCSDDLGRFPAQRVRAFVRAKAGLVELLLAGMDIEDSCR